MDRRIDWIVANGAFAAALYFGIVEQVDWLHYGLAAYVWWMLLSCVAALPKGSLVRGVASGGVSQLCVAAFDLGVLAAMFLAHWYWTAFAYAAYCGCSALVQSRSISKP